MYIVSDTGKDMVNMDNVYALQIAPSTDGMLGLIAFSVGINQAGPLYTPLAVGSKERCERAFEAIRKGIRDRQHIVDLLGLLGDRPNLTVAQPQIIRPGNGQGRPG